MNRPGWFAYAALALSACGGSSNDYGACSETWSRISVGVTVESTSQCSVECAAPPPSTSYIPVQYTCTANDGSSVACTAFTGSDGRIGCCYATYTDGGTVYDTIDYITKDCAPT